MARIANWTRLSSAELWQAWRNTYPDLTMEAAAARAVWAANKLIKSCSHKSRRRFYEVKDSFIRRHLAQATGRFVRAEIRECWGCEGSGYDAWGDECGRCGGDGVYSCRILYLHQFTIDGQQYSFHSYVRPENLEAGPGQDLEHYGTPFTDSEWATLPLPVSGLVRMLAWLSKNNYWGQAGSGLIKPDKQASSRPASPARNGRPAFRPGRVYADGPKWVDGRLVF